MRRSVSQPRSASAVINSFKQAHSLPTNTKQELRPAIRTIYPPGTPLFVQPVIKSSGHNNDMAIMMASYRKHISNYNKELEKKNAHILLYNKGVRQFRKEIRDRDGISTQQQVAESVWRKEHKELAPEEYNRLIERYNSKKGLLLNKRVVRQPVKPLSERYFAAFLYQYQFQINLHSKARRMPPYCNTLEPLPKYKIYPNKIKEAKQDTYQPLDVSPKTIRAHRDRLIEAGVLVNLQFHGRERAASVRVCEGILKVRDNAFAKADQKNSNTENQRLKKSQKNKVPHNNVSSSGQSLDKSKNRDKGVFSEKEKTILSPAESSTRTPKVQDAKKNDGPKSLGELQKKQTRRPRRPVAENALSLVLSDALEDRGDLCRGLAAGNHKEYTPLEPEILAQEAYYGAMHPADFEELAIQDVFKYAAVLFSTLHKVHPGSWMNAYKIWLQEKFHNPFGQRLSKLEILKRWMKCRDVLREVIHFSNNHPDWRPHYPSLYFDTARTFKENNSFEYAYQYFKLEPTKIEPRIIRKNKAGAEQRVKTDVQKAREKIRRYLDGKIDLQQVYDYTLHNLSPEVYQQINHLLTKERQDYYKASASA